LDQRVLLEAGVVEEEEAGSWMKDILCWEAWDGADVFPEPRGLEVDAT
jgi:hypothetical protein